MKGRHFKEVVETVCMTSGISKRTLCDILGIYPGTLCNWQNKGVPKAHMPYVMNTLRSLIRSGKYEGVIC